MKVVVSVPVNPFTGYGNDGISLVRALSQWGCDVFLQPSGVHPPLPRDVAAILTKPIPEHVDLHISHRCPQELAHPASTGIRSHATVTLAWTMYEWDSLSPVDEINDNNCEHAFSVTENLAEALSRFDAVMVYDEISRAAFTPYHPNVAVLQGGVESRPFIRRDWARSPFRFLMLGALSARKNPWVAIEAFRNLRGDGELADAELVLKTTVPGLHPGMEAWLPGLRVINRIMTEEELYGLLGSCHALLAPSWGEGKNIPAAQFAMSGGAVAAPIVGGHAQWLSEDIGFAVPYEFAEWTAGARGAKVSPDDLAEVMLKIYNNREIAAERGRAASQVLPAILSWESVCERLMLRLPELAGDRGREVSALMRAARRPFPTEAQIEARAARALDGVR